MRLDARRPLEDLNAEWEQCTKCELGVHRQEVGGEFVRGEGTTRGIMLIGEGPGSTEEKHGRPFVGKSGKLLRRILDKLNITDVCYITNIVACRSCILEMDENGQPRTSNVRGITIPRYKDKPPTASQAATCLPRLYEEIYLVDPLLIVTLGAPASATLLKHSVSIVADSGTEEHLEIPGVASIPTFTEKKRDWVRNIKGRLVATTERNVVRYLAIPTLHPAYVDRNKEADRSDNSPLSKFCRHLKMAAVTFSRMAEHYGITLDSEIREDISLAEIEDEEAEEDGY